MVKRIMGKEKYCLHQGSVSREGKLYGGCYEQTTEFVSFSLPRKQESVHTCASQMGENTYLC